MVPGYEIVRPLGRGAMGLVVLARQVRLDRPVAIKFLSTEDQSGIGPRAARFRREAELMARISHPNILSIYDSGEIDDLPYLVMEYIEGGDLRRLMRPGRPMPTSQACSILSAVAGALGHLHRVGILHRDLKPENILMHDGDNPKVADFGLAVLRAGTGSLTETREGLGTLGYMAPEQRYRLRVDERADQYSLAAIAYELLTGECPVGIIRPASELNTRLRKGVDVVLLRALQEDPDDRYPSIADLSEALQSAIRAAAQSTRGRTPRWPRVLSLVGAICAAMLLGTLWLWSGRFLKRFNDEDEGLKVTRPELRLTPGRSPAGHEASTGESIEAGLFSRRTNVIGMQMVQLPAGTFRMGSPEDDSSADESERPTRVIRISSPFWMGAHEVTVDQFRTFVKETGHVTVAEIEGGRIWDSTIGEMHRDVAFNWRDPGYGVPPADEHPVVQVAREDAIAFCQWLSRKDNLPYRLPTEAEWEYACRAGTTSRWSMGDDPSRLTEFAWFRANAGRQLHPVGGKHPNPWGLFDLHGNARELCSDWYAPYPVPEAEGTVQIDPTGPEKGYRWAVRGGAWDSIESESQTRSASRSHKVFPYFTVGFRVCHDGARAIRLPVVQASGSTEGP
jgi:formylglycine-generating enzyme required for sulfatase activity/predicted Ser/Thr protein kinase